MPPMSMLCMAFIESLLVRKKSSKYAYLLSFVRPHSQSADIVRFSQFFFCNSLSECRDWDSLQTLDDSLVWGEVTPLTIFDYLSLLFSSEFALLNQWLLNFNVYCVCCSNVSCDRKHCVRWCLLVVFPS